MSSERLPYERWLEFRYTRPLPVMDRIFVGVWIALWVAAAAVAFTEGRDVWLAPLGMLVFLPLFIAERRKAFLEIGRKSMRCEVTPGRKTCISWDAVTEVRESHFDLGIVYLAHSNYSRISLPKSYFKEEHWRQITAAISERALSHVPDALVEMMNTPPPAELPPAPDETHPE